MKFFNLTLFCFLIVGILVAVTTGFRVEPDNSMHRSDDNHCRGGEGRGVNCGHHTTPSTGDDVEEDHSEGITGVDDDDESPKNFKM